MAEVATEVEGRAEVAVEVQVEVAACTSLTKPRRHRLSRGRTTGRVRRRGRCGRLDRPRHCRARTEGSPPSRGVARRSRKWSQAQQQPVSARGACLGKASQLAPPLVASSDLPTLRTRWRAPTSHRYPWLPSATRCSTPHSPQSHAGAPRELYRGQS